MPACDACRDARVGLERVGSTIGARVGLPSDSGAHVQRRADDTRVWWWGDVQKKFIDAWAYQVRQEPRMVAMLEDGAVKLITKAETILKDASSEAQRQPFALVCVLLATLLPPPHSGRVCAHASGWRPVEACSNKQGLAPPFCWLSDATVRSDCNTWPCRWSRLGRCRQCPSLTFARQLRARRGPFSRTNTRSRCRCT